MKANADAVDVQKLNEDVAPQKKNKIETSPFTGSAASTPVTNLSKSYPLERNMLGVPTCVLHPKAAEKVQALFTSWDGGDGKLEFTFIRGISPFPIPQHAMIFDVLLGMFARNWRPDGCLYFTFSDVLRAAGKNPNSGTGQKCVEEAILRYRRCTAQFETSWYKQGRRTTWNGHFITHTDIWDVDENGRTLKRNPRNGRKTEYYHMIRFNAEIVDSLERNYYRILHKHTLSLKSDTYVVFRYFYSFGDRKPTHRTFDQLRTVFLWMGQANRFKPWLEKRLNECVEAGYMQWFEIKKTSVSVKCNKLKDKLENKQRRAGAEVLDVNAEERQYKDSELLGIYLEAKSKGRIDDATIAGLERIIATGNIRAYGSCIRNRMQEWGY